MDKYEAISRYKRLSPVHGRSKVFKEDVNSIKRSSSPISVCDKLLKKRNKEYVEGMVQGLMVSLYGRKKRYKYGQEAVIAIEHILDKPMDPHTQLPLWIDMLKKTKNSHLGKEEFVRGFHDIVLQEIQVEKIY